MRQRIPMDVTNSHQPEVMEFFVLFYSPVSLSLFFFSLCRFISHCDILFIKGRKIVQFEANLYRSMEGGGARGLIHRIGTFLRFLHHIVLF